MEFFIANIGLRQKISHKFLCLGKLAIKNSNKADDFRVQYNNISF